MRSGLVQYHEDLTPLMQPIDTVEQHTANYNNGDVEQIMASIERIGMYRPIIVDRDSRQILAGNHTWMACKQLEATQIPVIFFDGDDEQQLAALVADNGIAAKARPDDAMLLDLLKDLEANSVQGIEGLGFDHRDIERMQRIVETPLDTTEMQAVVEKQQWPTLFITVPPETHAGFYELAGDVEGGDRERLEAIMKMAGWRG